MLPLIHTRAQGKLNKLCSEWAGATEIDLCNALDVPTPRAEGRPYNHPLVWAPLFEKQTRDIKDHTELSRPWLWVRDR